MKMLEKVTHGAGIALNYIAGVASMWFGGVCTLITLAIWGFAGFGMPLVIFFVLFGVIPIGVGAWLFRRGKIQRQLLKVKLLKETVRKLAFKNKGRLRPIDLAQERGCPEEQALEILKSLTAEDPNRMNLQLDYESGDIYFEFSDIIRAWSVASPGGKRIRICQFAICSISVPWGVFVHRPKNKYSV